MKKKHIVIALLVIGIILVGLSLALATAATANTNIIGGADWPTFTLVFFYKNEGLFSSLASLGVILIVTSAVVGFRKHK